MSKLLRGATAQLLLLTVLPLALVLAVISFGSIALHQQAMRDLVGQRVWRTVMATANSLGTTIQRKLDTLRGSASDVAALTVPATDLSTGLGEVLATHDALRELPGGIAVYRSDGRLITATSSAQAWATTDLVDDLVTRRQAVPTAHRAGRQSRVDRPGSRSPVRNSRSVAGRGVAGGRAVNPDGASGRLAAIILIRLDKRCTTHSPISNPRTSPPMPGWPKR